MEYSGAGMLNAECYCTFNSGGAIPFCRGQHLSRLVTPCCSYKRPNVVSFHELYLLLCLNWLRVEHVLFKRVAYHCGSPQVSSYLMVLEWFHMNLRVVDLPYEQLAYSAWGVYCSQISLMLACFTQRYSLVLMIGVKGCPLKLLCLIVYMHVNSISLIL